VRVCLDHLRAMKLIRPGSHSQQRLRNLGYNGTSSVWRVVMHARDKGNGPRFNTVFELPSCRQKARFWRLFARPVPFNSRIQITTRRTDSLAAG
jgi:hypothetical protein